MKPDHPTIERIRQVKHEISARFGHDPRRMVDYYLELQKNTPPERFYRPCERDKAEDSITQASNGESQTADE